jgi:hypothetical protein
MHLMGLPQQASAAQSPVTTVRLLLAAYADTLDVIDGLPAIPMVATGWHWRTRLSAPIRLPRGRWMLRSLMLWHIERVLAAAERVFHRRSALGIAGVGEADALSTVTEFRASLPSRSRVLRFGALGIAALVLARVIATLLPHIGAHGRLGTATAPERLYDNTLGALQLTASSVGSEVDTLVNAPPGALAAAALLLSACLYLVLRPVVSAFRLKRLLLNLYPHADSMRSSTPATWSVSRSTGVYRLEREIFAAFGARIPGEPPLDLLTSLLVPIIWIALSIENASIPYPEPLWLLLIDDAIWLIVLSAPAAIRLAWLAAAWRARNGSPRSAWLLADQVSVPWRPEPVRSRSPVLIGWLSLMVPFFPFLYVIAWWPWWSTARDLRELGRAYDIKHLRDMHPAAQAFAASPGALLGLGLPTLVVLWRAPRYVREAQAAIGLERPVSRHIAWLSPLWPVLCVLLQRELNRLWHAQDVRIGPHHPAIDLARTIDPPDKARWTASEDSGEAVSGGARGKEPARPESGE